ncbi:VirB4-like conjugal transfer ATPase, CD1110 family [Patescibacteria group bacterium]
MDPLKSIKKFIDPMPDNEPVNNDKKGPLAVYDIIAPPSIEVDFDNLKIGDYYIRTLFAAGYPRFVSANWLDPMISFNHTLDISMFIYPTHSEEVLSNLKRKVGEMEATIQSDIKRGKVIEPSVQVALEDAIALQQEIAKGAERFFQFGLYITIPSKSLDDLNKTTKQVESLLSSLLVVTKKAVLQMEEGFKTTLPVGQDRIMITRNMDTTSLSTTFPFTTSELTANEGVMYGINEGNGSLVIFDRFTLENANTVVFGKSGAGKSYAIKLEIMRSMMFDTEVIVIDPENEYEDLTQALGGEYIAFRFGAETKINPFDMALLRTGGEKSELNQKILSLHGFFRVVMGKLTPTEDAVLDRALILTYKQKGITPDPATQGKEPPLVEDLYKTLIGMEDNISRGLADRIEKFVKGSLVGIFDSQTNIKIKNQLTVFSIRDLEDEIRPIAMYLILDYIWTKVRKDIKKRLLIVDEAWYMMKHPDSATFLNSMAKRARKYYLGVTTITQDVEDFLSVDLGKAIIQNSSLQFLMKQSPAAIDKVAKIFYLSEGEKHLLLSADIGEGLLFAGPAHAAIRTIASPQEHELVTTKPQELEKRSQKQALEREKIAPSSSPQGQRPVVQKTQTPQPQTPIAPNTDPKPQSSFPAQKPPSAPPKEQTVISQGDQTPPQTPRAAVPNTGPNPQPPPAQKSVDLNVATAQKPKLSQSRPIFTVETVGNKPTNDT